MKTKLLLILILPLVVFLSACDTMPTAGGISLNQFKPLGADDHELYLGKDTWNYHKIHELPDDELEAIVIEALEVKRISLGGLVSMVKEIGEEEREGFGEYMDRIGGNYLYIFEWGIRLYNRGQKEAARKVIDRAQKDYRYLITTLREDNQGQIEANREARRFWSNALAEQDLKKVGIELTWAPDEVEPVAIALKLHQKNGWLMQVGYNHVYEIKTRQGSSLPSLFEIVVSIAITATVTANVIATYIHWSRKREEEKQRRAAERRAYPDLASDLLSSYKSLDQAFQKEDRKIRRSITKAKQNKTFGSCIADAAKNTLGAMSDSYRDKISTVTKRIAKLKSQGYSEERFRELMTYHTEGVAIGTEYETSRQRAVAALERKVESCAG